MNTGLIQLNGGFRITPHLQRIGWADSRSAHAKMAAIAREPDVVARHRCMAEPTVERLERWLDTLYDNPLAPPAVAQLENCMNELAVYHEHGRELVAMSREGGSRLLGWMRKGSAAATTCLLQRQTPRGAVLDVALGQLPSLKRGKRAHILSLRVLMGLEQAGRVAEMEALRSAIEAMDLSEASLWLTRAACAERTERLFAANRQDFNTKIEWVIAKAYAADVLMEQGRWQEAREVAQSVDGHISQASSYNQVLCALALGDMAELRRLCDRDAIYTQAFVGGMIASGIWACLLYARLDEPSPWWEEYRRAAAQVREPLMRRVLREALKREPPSSERVRSLLELVNE